MSSFAARNSLHPPAEKRMVNYFGTVVCEFLFRVIIMRCGPPGE